VFVKDVITAGFNYTVNNEVVIRISTHAIVNDPMSMQHCNGRLEQYCNVCTTIQELQH